MSIQKDVLRLDYVEDYVEPEQLRMVAEPSTAYGTDNGSTEEQIARLEIEMKAAAKELEFERAASIRNRIRALKLRELELKPGG